MRFTRIIGTAVVFGIISSYLVVHGQAGKDDKKPDITRSVAEIEKLIKDLGDRDFRVRDIAIRALKDAPGALTILRTHVGDKDLERQKRVRLLVNELTEQNCKRLLEHISARKERAPLDLLTDLVTSHTDRFTDDDWKTVLNTIATTRAHFLKECKVKASVPDPNQKFAKYTLLVNDDLTSLEPFIARRIVGKRTSADLSRCALIASHSVSGTSFGGSIILANGDVNVADGASLGDFVFSDGNVTCRTILGSLVIASGQVRVVKTENAVIFEGNNDITNTAFFSMEFVGLTFLQKNDTISVLAVEGNSLAEKGGFCIGDVILLDAKGKTLESIQRTLRRSLAKELELSVRIRRAGEERILILSSLHK